MGGALALNRESHWGFNWGSESGSEVYKQMDLDRKPSPSIG